MLDSLMLPKAKQQKFWRIAIINLVVFVLCGVATITLITLFSNPIQASGTNNQIILACTYLPPEHTGVNDYGHRWQIYEIKNNETITTWDAIYAAQQIDQQILQVPDTILVTPDGLVYTGPLSAIGTFTATVTYNNRNVQLKIS